MAYVPVSIDAQNLIKEAEQDDKLKAIVERIQRGEVPSGFTYKHGVLWLGDRVVIAENSTWIPKLLEEYNQTPQGGHAGFYRTYRSLVANLYWKGMKNMVQQFVRACDTCQRQKYIATTPNGLLQPLQIPERVWEDISMDFITGLSKAKGYEALLVVVDRLSKYLHFIPLKHPYTAKTLVEIFVKEVVWLHGIPNSIVIL